MSCCAAESWNWREKKRGPLPEKLRSTSPILVRAGCGVAAAAEPALRRPSSDCSNVGAKSSLGWCRTAPGQSWSRSSRDRCFPRQPSIPTVGLATTACSCAVTNTAAFHHHENEFVRGKNHVNGIESFWSYAKFRFLKLRGVRPEFFFLHLKESEWRWNHRTDNLYFLLLKNLRQKPL